MSHLRNFLACFVLLVSIRQANTGGLRTSTSSQGSGLVFNALVGLAAVAGFLFIVFFLLIVKRLFFIKDTDEEESDPEVCAAYENTAFEVETPLKENPKTTSM
ncbi:small integral membrane protein 24 isoform X2 [Tachysurus fulvidraco]|uniref:small integral membrane protein 24 isoform X2 n=1 Tax=Tachysurus fulvidraco TaxID=1234273 RepID=UPI001FF07BB7|nr:small integral membrane protein 24 isoform X2 [Tachysurus fulvidraco]